VTLISSISEKTELNKELKGSTDINSGSAVKQNTELDFATDLVNVHQDVISKGFLGADEANQLLADFVVTSAEFPLIVLPFHADLESLRWERPCLLLAILTACARDHLQTQLEVEFRKMLADRVVLRAEKGIDLLQGLLVFLTW
jgi:hypothetical protein